VRGRLLDRKNRLIAACSTKPESGLEPLTYRLQGGSEDERESSKAPENAGDLGEDDGSGAPLD
jgi:hypothetical protein